MLHAQTDPSIITRSTMYGAGFANVYDNYLSPQEYRGVEFRLLRESERAAKRSPEKWQLQTLFQGFVDYTHNRADNNHTLAAMVNWNYGWLYKFYQSGQWQVQAGGMADINGGFIYNMRNGNNPANARLYTNADATARVFWNTHIKRTPILLRYQLSVPLVGVMFSPHYGQSYYEIFSLNDNKGVVKTTTPFSQPSAKSILSADIEVFKTTLRLAYVCEIQQAKLNGIKSHLYSNAFMIGVVKHLKKL